MTPGSPTTCPRCGAAASGNFCASCGNSLGPRACSACSTPLATDAKFCPSCGTAAAGGSGASGSTSGSKTPWLVAAILSVVAISTIVYSARSRNEPVGPDMANAGNAAPAGAGNSTAVTRAPDISNMTPRERFTRLSDRIQTAIETRDSNQVFQFFPMAEGAFTQLSATERDVDARYHMGMLWAQVGEFAKAKAQADSIMKVASGNLFGFYMYAMLAEFRGDSTAARKARSDFRANYDSEIKKDRPEYKDHEPFLDTYRKGPGAK